MALADAGCEVHALCSRRHPVASTRALTSLHPYHALAPLRSIRAAFFAVQPHLLIPSDDLATFSLHRLHALAGNGRRASLMRELIEHSLGPAASFSIAAQRSSLMSVARDEGVRVPVTSVVRNSQELDTWIERNGLPAVLKSDGTSGGRGVALVHTSEEATRALHRLSAPPSVARAVKRAVVNHDANYLLPCVRRTRQVVSAQAFVAGQDANRTVACWKGRVLASVTVMVVHTVEAQGPASVVKVIDDCEIKDAIEKIVSRLGLSGIVGFDFVVEDRTGEPYLIEMNPRATQTGHLRLGAGRDLPASLHAVLSGEPLREVPSVTTSDTIAYFPQEWSRDADSRFLSTAYHDVPWEEPNLVRRCIVEVRGLNSWSGFLANARVKKTASQQNAEVGWWT